MPNTPFRQKNPRPVVVYDEAGNAVFNGRPLRPLGYVQVPVPVNSITTLPAVPDGVSLALFKVEVAAIRYRDDGVDPTSAVGMPLLPGESMTYDAVMADIRMTGQTTGAIANVSFYGPAV